MIIDILRNEMEMASRGLIPHIDTDLISKWSKFSKEEIKQLREICFMLTWDNIISDMAFEKREENLSMDKVEELLLKEVSERIEFILETYPYSWDIVKYALPFNLVNDTKEISKNSIDDMSDIKIYARKLYVLHKAIQEEVY